MPAQIKYATVSGHSVGAVGTVSGALISDDAADSLTPSGKVKLCSIRGEFTGGTLGAGQDVTIQLTADSAGLQPLSDRLEVKCLLTSGSDPNKISGVAARIEMHSIVTGSVYVCSKLSSGKSATVSWTLYFRQGG
tara:strand:+ start:118 stop:522 length:405 start_codon:yes stop_codon:yes gene_type:complete